MTTSNSSEPCLEALRELHTKAACGKLSCTTLCPHRVNVSSGVVSIKTGGQSLGPMIRYVQALEYRHITNARCAQKYSSD
eukprot:15038149-Ditylum_brightwellii.AAC.1